MKAIIMAGGKGTRLRPLTCTKPKPMVPLANNPVMTHTLELLKQQGFKEIGVTVQHLASNIIDYYKDGKEYGVNLRYFIEEIPLGTAGSVKNAQEFLDDTFLVISGDGLTDINLKEALNFHKKKKSLATLVLTSVENPLEYGIVITKENGEIVRFLEKPSWSEVFSDKVNTGIYILEPEVLNFIPNNKFFDFSKDLFPLLMEKRFNLKGFSGKGYWCDIGNCQAYLQAHLDILENKVSTFYLPYEKYESDNIWVGKNTEIHPKAVLKGPLVIGNNCYIGSDVFLEKSFISDNCKIMNGASIKRSVLWNGVNIGRGSALRGAVLCSNVHLKADSSVYEGAIIGNDTLIREKCIIKPGTKIWPAKRIEEGVILKNNMVWGQKASKNLFGEYGIKGEYNIDLSLEQVIRLGHAFGSILSMGKNVGVSCDGKVMSRVLKEVFISGLLVTGQKVYDLGDLTAPITRYSIKNGNFEGGVHISYFDQDNSVKIIFINENGANISKAQEKKIENLLLIDDFRFVPAHKIQNKVVLNNLIELYFESLRNQVKQKVSLKVLFYCPLQELSKKITELLKKIGCEVQKINTDKINEELIKNKGDIGFILGSDGEELVLLDEKGNSIRGDKLKVLLAYILFKEIKSSILIAPIDAPSVLEQIASKYQGKVVRTKSALQTVMEYMLVQGDYGEKQFYLEFDGLQALLAVLKTLVNSNLKLSEIISQLPAFYLHRDTVDCPWEVKGKIIRSLIENMSHDNFIESIEGVKFETSKGWTLVLPDSEKPLVKIICESTSPETALETVNIYKEKIQQIMGI